MVAQGRVTPITAPRGGSLSKLVDHKLGGVLRSGSEHVSCFCLYLEPGGHRAEGAGGSFAAGHSRVHPASPRPPDTGSLRCQHGGEHGAEWAFPDCSGLGSGAARGGGRISRQAGSFCPEGGNSADAVLLS